MTHEQLFQRSAQPAELLIRQAHVLDPRCGLDTPLDVLIRGGLIAELGEPGATRPPSGAAVIEAAGKHLFPAFSDPHVHLRTPGQEHKETIETGTAAAAAGGFCQLIAMPNTAPVVDQVSVLEALRARACAQASVPTGFLAAITVGLAGEELTEMAALRDAGALGFTDDGRPLVAAGVLRKALQYQRLAGGVVALHEEDPSLSADGVMHEGAVSARLGLAGIPSISESTMIDRDAAIARYEDARVHFQHLSAAASVEALSFWRSTGTRVSGEVTPHHLTLTDQELLRLDANFKMNPPLRSEADRQALIDGLRTGVIECIATDHAPHARHEKEMPFEQAPMGTTGLETAFAALYTELVAPGVLSLAVLIERMTAGGSLYGLALPRVATGEQANIVLVDLAREWRVGESGYRSHSQNCCFDARRLTGVVELTVAGGSVAHAAPGVRTTTLEGVS